MPCNAFATVDQVTVLVVTYNSAHCIAALAPTLSTLPFVILIDNASTDNTISEVKRLLPKARIINNTHNLGFGAANNRGLAETHTPYALLLNPDCEPASDFFVSLMAATVRFPDAAIIAPQLLQRDDRIDLNYRWPSTHWSPSGPAAEGPCCIGFTSGAAFLLNMQQMKNIGFFDEGYFLYYEDEDLCMRVFNARLQIILVPDVHLRHLSRRSSGNQALLRDEFWRGYHHAQSKLVFERKYGGSPQAQRLRWKTLGLALLLLVVRIALPQPRYLFRVIGRISGLIRWH